MAYIPSSSGITTSPPKPLYATNTLSSITNSLLTVIRILAIIFEPSTLKTIVVFPFLRPVTTPFSSTLATEGLVEEKDNLY